MKWNERTLFQWWTHTHARTHQNSTSKPNMSMSVRLRLNNRYMPTSQSILSHFPKIALSKKNHWSIRWVNDSEQKSVVEIFLFSSVHSSFLPFFSLFFFFFNVNFTIPKHTHAHAHTHIDIICANWTVSKLNLGLLIVSSRLPKPSLSIFVYFNSIQFSWSVNQISAKCKKLDTHKRKSFGRLIEAQSSKWQFCEHKKSLSTSPPSRPFECDFFVYSLPNTKQIIINALSYSISSFCKATSHFVCHCAVNHIG